MVLSEELLPEKNLGEAIRKLVDPSTIDLKNRYSNIPPKIAGAAAQIECAEATLNELAGIPDGWDCPIFPEITSLSDTIQQYTIKMPARKGYALERITDMIREIGSKRATPLNFGLPGNEDEEIRELKTKE